MIFYFFLVFVLGMAWMYLLSILFSSEARRSLGRFIDDAKGELDLDPSVPMAERIDRRVRMYRFISRFKK